MISARLSVEWKAQGGLTIVELLLALAIMAGVSVVFVALLTSGLDAWEAGTAQSRTDQEARLALERISRELRASRSRAGDITIGAGNTSIAYPLDTDNDGAYETTVRYFMSGSDLMRQENGLPTAGNRVLKDVTGVVFDDLYGNSRLIAVTLAVIHPVEGAKGKGAVTMETSVGPRND